MDKEDIRPRKYQEEIFEQAKQGNVIASLNTGSGKTLISILLIKWITLRETAKPKIVVFLVPKVALVEQQGNFIARHTPLRVAKWHGALELSLSDRDGWQTQFEENDVFVMTAQVFLNILTFSLWSLDKVSLLVFDECHHARKNHPYNSVMREYFQLPRPHRPKVFGMTASPVWNMKDPVRWLSTLEENLDAKIISVRDHTAELASHSPKPIEITKIYPVPIQDDVFPSPSILQCMELFDATIWDLLNIPWSNIRLRYWAALANLGPYAASLFLFSEIESQLAPIISSQLLYDESQAMDTDTNFPQSMPHYSPNHGTIPPEAYEIYDILLDYAPWFPPPSDPSKTPVPVSLDWCTPKIRVLVDILLSYTNTPKDAPEGGNVGQGFQGIIFVEQRQNAALLSLLLSNLEELRGKIKCAYLVGSGASQEGMPIALATSDNARETIQQFRKGDLNLLIATSVAEEGLDFPACDLVIRFDPVQHLVGYLQSRGRARNKTSTFIVMIREDDKTHHDRYKKLNQAEPLMQQVVHDRDSMYYQWNGQLYRAGPDTSNRERSTRRHAEEDEQDESVDPRDFRERERYTVPTTGSVLTYDNAIQLMNTLCSAIPRDKYTPPPKPIYHLCSEDESHPGVGMGYSFTLHMPTGLPLHKEDRVFKGPPKGSKKEAKRAVAFQALKRLREKEVINEYLHSTFAGSGHRGSAIRYATEVKNFGVGMGGQGRAEEYIEKWIKKKLRRLGALLNVGVIDPWYISDEGALWIHDIEVIRTDDKFAGHGKIGVVTSAVMPQGVTMPYEDQLVRVGDVRKLILPVTDDQDDARRTMESFTRFVVWLQITGSPIGQPLTAYIVLLDSDGQPDLEAMEEILQHPRGNPDWDALPPGSIEENQVLAMNENLIGRLLRIVRTRDDLTPMSEPCEGSREAGFSTYCEYFTQRWTRKKGVPNVPSVGPMVEGIYVLRSNNGVYPAFTDNDSHGTYVRPDTALDGIILPQIGTKWFILPEELNRIAPVLPSFLGLLTDVYRARAARFSLSLPPISDSLLVEALTIPSVNLPFSNQRLETLGDAVLGLAVSVHMFEKWKLKHEGQLTSLRQMVVKNWFLMRRALENGLERFVSAEVRAMGKGRWRFVIGANADAPSKRAGPDGCFAENDIEEGEVVESAVGVLRQAPKIFPRRSLQDCVEAILGAAFLTGGFPMALQAGTSLGMAFGGAEPWEARYARRGEIEYERSSPLFMQLQEALGYSFKKNELLIEAVTHPSFATTSEGQSYQRLEFLGDSILNLVVVRYLYEKFPNATSEQLAMPRSKAVCAAALAHIAVRTLGLHKILLANSVDLSMDIDRYIPMLEKSTGRVIVEEGWRYDPPKALSDVFESVIGAIMVDSGYNYEVTAAIVETVMEDVLEALTPQMKKDPVSELTEWTAKNGCTGLKLVKQGVEKPHVKGVGYAALVHDTVIAGPFLSGSLAVARFVAAERALAILQAGESPKSLKDLCTCGRSMEVDPDPLATSNITADEDPEYNSEQADAEEVQLILTAVEPENEEVEEPPDGVDAVLEPLEMALISEAGDS